jgi:hypothetical protein
MDDTALDSNKQCFIVTTHWRNKGSEKAEVFRKIEPYLAFLNINHLERQGADILSKVNELEEVNQSLRERDTRKDDAMAMLSDQLLTMTERLRDWKGKSNGDSKMIFIVLNLMNDLIMAWIRWD